MVAMAPHVFVEDITVTSIAQAREVFKSTDLGQRLGRYHRDATHMFWGWNDIWLDPAFRDWNIEDVVPKIAVPILVIQGNDDEYGTRAQCDSIAAHAKAPCTLTMLDNCRHSPHRDQPQATTDAIAAFVAAIARTKPAASLLVAMILALPAWACDTRSWVPSISCVFTLAANWCSIFRRRRR